MYYQAIRETLNSKPILIPENQPIKVNNPNRDYYSSLFLYTEEHKKLYEEKHTLSGIKNTVTNRIYFDFDSESDLELARKDVLTLLDRLKDDVQENQLNIFFSGKKGFAVEFHISTKINPIQFKNFIFGFAEDLSTFDRVITDPNRIVRLNNSKHQDSGLYKILLTKKELETLNISQIKELAKVPRNLPLNIKEVIVDTEYLKTLDKEEKKNVVVNSDVEEIDGIRGLKEIDWNKKPKGVPKCLYGLSFGVMKSGIGERSLIFYRLGNFYRNQGFDQITNYHLLKGIAELNHKLYPEYDRFSSDEIWNNIIKQIYSNSYSFKQLPGTSATSPENEIILRYCECISKVNPRPCNLHGKTKEDTSLISAIEVEDKFKYHAENFEQSLIKTGLTELDNCVSMTRSTVNILSACCGVGKSSVALTTLLNTNRNNIKSVFFSMDMGSPTVFIKMALLVTNYTKDDIYKAYQDKNTKLINEIREKIVQSFKNTSFDFSNTLSLEEIKQRVWEIEQRDSKKVDYVIVDYFSRLSAPSSDEYSATNYNSLKAVETAAELDSTMLFLAQISRANGDGSTPIKNSRISRGSGMIEEIATNLIGAYRPFLGDPEKDNYIRLSVVKNRMGPNKNILLGWEGPKGLIRNLNEEELAWFEENLAPIEEESNKGKFNF